MGHDIRATPTSQPSLSSDRRGSQGAESPPRAPRTVVLLGGWLLRVDGDPDDRIDAIAARQRCRFSREQLLQAGVPPEVIKRRVRSGRLIRVHHGVYGLPHTEDVPLATETAALLACGHDAVLSFHSATTLRGLRPGIARPVHVTIPATRHGPRPHGVIVHRSCILSPADITLHRGLPVTSPARTYLDIAAALPDRDVERLLSEGLFVLRIVTHREIDDVLARAGGHPGRARLAQIAKGPLTRTDSPPEAKLLGLIRAGRLPEPETQVWILDYQLDMYWPDLRLAVEVDAYGTHGSRERFELDRRKDARLLAEKHIVVLRPTDMAITHRPFEVIASLARAIAQRQRPDYPAKRPPSRLP